MSSGHIASLTAFWIVNLVGFTTSVPGQVICLDGLHGNPLFHDGTTFAEPLVTQVLSDYKVESVGPIGARFEPGMGLSATLLRDYRVLICYLPIDPFSAEELSAIRTFVDGGGGLLLVADNGEDLGLAAANQVASVFGAEFERGVVAAPRAVKAFVLGEHAERYVPDMRFPYYFDARAGDHPIARGIRSLPARAAGAISGGTPIAWAEGDPRITDLPASMWLDGCDPYDVYQPDKIAQPQEIQPKAVILSALTSGRGRVVLWADALLTRFELGGYAGEELKQTVTAVARNIVSWLVGDEPSATSPHAAHPVALPLDRQYVFFRHQLGRAPGESGRVQVTGPHGYSASCVIDQASPVHFSTGQAAPGEYRIGRRRVIVIAERRLHVLNGDETEPDDICLSSKDNTLEQDHVQALQRLRQYQEHFGANGIADYPCRDPLTACQVAAELGMEVGTVYHGWMVKPVGSLAAARCGQSFIFTNLPELIWGIQTTGFNVCGPPRDEDTGIRKLSEIYNTPGFLFWNTGPNEPTMVYLDARSPHDLNYYRDTVLRWGYQPRDFGVSSWSDVTLHPLCDEYMDVGNGNMNPYPDEVLRRASDARETRIGSTPEALLSWHLTNWAALKLHHDKFRCARRFADSYYPDLITCGGHEADWPYYYDNIALARGGHQWLEPGEMISVHGWSTPLAGLSYQAGAMVEIEQARLQCHRGAWIRYKNFTGDCYEDILATDELFEHTFATALAHGAGHFGVEKIGAVGRRGGAEESKEFLARANRLRAVWLNLAGEPSTIAVYRPGTHSLKAVLEDVNWGWIAAVRGLGGAQVNYLFRWNLRRGDLDRYKVLLLFGSHLLEKDIAERIAEWVRKGGILIGDLHSGRWDERYQERFWLKDVFGGVPVEEPLTGNPQRIQFDPGGDRLIMAGVHPDTPPADYRDLKPLDETTKSLGGFREHGRGPAITSHPYGKGVAILVGLRMGREQWRRGHSPGLEDLLGALIRAHHTPLVQTDQRDVEVGVWNGGSAKYLVAVRHIPPPPPTSPTDRELIALDGFGPLETRIRVQGAWDVYQLIGPEHTDLLYRRLGADVANGQTVFATTIPLRDFNVYAVFPRDRGPKALGATPDAPRTVAGSTVPVRIELDVAGDTPAEIEVISEGGDKLYGDQLLLHDGKGVYALATAPNDPPGKWSIRARDLIAGLEAQASVTVVPPAASKK